MCVRIRVCWYPCVHVSMAVCGLLHAHAVFKGDGEFIITKFQWDVVSHCFLYVLLFVCIAVVADFGDLRASEYIYA